ncbi:MAG: type II toxin-antitoxin system HicA family toxin [Sedimentisphaeraceae bacterium JB056]
MSPRISAVRSISRNICRDYANIRPLTLKAGLIKRLDKKYIVGYTLSMPSEVKFSKVKKMLEGKGYTLARVSGSHHIFVKPKALPVSIPVHNRKVKPYYVRQIEKL